MSRDLIIVCPPYPQFKEAPLDQPGSTLFACPRCKDQMWLSKYKKSLLLFYSLQPVHLILRCYDCAEKMASEEPELLEDQK